MSMEILNEVGNWFAGAGVAFFTFMALSKVYFYILVKSAGGEDKIGGHPLDALAILAFIFGGVVMANYFWPYF